VKVKSVKIALDSFGSFLGMQKGCFIVKDKKGKVEKYPLFENEIGEVQLRSGNSVSVGALTTLGFWGINCLIMTGRGKPIAVVKNLEDDSHVKTRICQYEALKNGKGSKLAKTFILGKIQGQNELLKKYGLKRISFSVFEKIKKLDETDMRVLRRKLLYLEGSVAKFYFKQIFELFNASVKPSNRRTFKAYDGINNLFNLAYTLLFWKVHIALVKAKLEPYLGFMHTIKYGQPSLICDFQELYRYLMDDFVIRFGRKLSPKDFSLKEDSISKRKSKRVFLKGSKSQEFMRKLNRYFETFVNVPRIRVGNRQELETLICEEALVFASCLRSRKKMWKPRIPKLSEVLN